MRERHQITFVVETDAKLEVDAGNLLNGAILALPDLLSCLAAECYLPATSTSTTRWIRIIEDETSVEELTSTKGLWS